MQLKLLFFGILTDITGISNLELETVIDNSEELNNFLKKKYSALSKYNYKIAVNQHIISQNTNLKDGDEVAFLPPFSGG